jgi:NitT/TauT family transport system substrate-binding protein
MEGGALDITHSPVVSLLQAREQGFDLVLAVADNSAAEKSPDQGATLVLKDGPIKSYRDLEGKKVAVNSLASVEFLALALAIRNSGGDDKKVDWIEIDQSQMVDGLVAHQFDAAVTSEPAQSVGLKTGKLQVLGYQYVDSMPGLALGAYVTTHDFAESHSDAIQKFADAVKKTHQYLVDNPKEVPSLLAQVLDADVSTFDSIVLPVWPLTVHNDSLDELVDLAVEFGFIKKKADVKDYVWPSAY